MANTTAGDAAKAKANVAATKNDPKAVKPDMKSTGSPEGDAEGRDALSVRSFLNEAGTARFLPFS